MYDVFVQSTCLNLVILKSYYITFPLVIENVYLLMEYNYVHLYVHESQIIQSNIDFCSTSVHHIRMISASVFTCRERENNVVKIMLTFCVAV